MRKLMLVMDPAHAQKKRFATAIALGLILAAIVLFVAKPFSGKSVPADPSRTITSTNAQSSEPIVELAPTQVKAITIQPVGTRPFAIDKEELGNIDFDNNLSVQVFPPNQGKIIATLADLGDVLQKGQPLYTIDSPDLIQAESTLIAAAATFDLTTRELARAKDLHTTDVGVSQRELEQATSDQQTAEGALKAAHDAVRVFGKSDAEIDQIVKSRQIDSALVVRSPISGEVTARNAQPGLLAVPGAAPAPFSVSDVTRKWLLASIPESESPMFHVGQAVQVKVAAYPDKIFRGTIARTYAAVDPGTHRATLRSEIDDPQNQLRPGMLANFVIRVQDPVQATALPANAVVRESDGTMTAWVTTDQRHFLRRTIKLGLQNDGWWQVLDGVKPAELAVSDGAVFLSNILLSPPSD